MAVSEAAKQRLIHFFATHPAWKSAAKPLGEGVCSTVSFAGESEPWSLIRRGGITVLERADPVNPDFHFDFTEGAVYYLTSDEASSIGDFATRMYECCFLLDEDHRVEFKVLSSVGQILKRGYWIIVLKGGLKVLRIARQHGLGGVKDIRRLFGLLSGKSSEEVRTAILSVRRE